DRLLASERRRFAPGSAIRRALSDIGLQTDLPEMVRILAMAEPLRRALDAVSAAATRGSGDKRIAELGPDAVTEAKMQYLRLSEAVGVETRYLALGLMSRLEHSWQILRLGRALAWKPVDALLRDTEFGIIGQRLIRDLQNLIRDIEATAPSLRRGTHAVIDYARLR